ncbi:DUF808 domain-containing protein [Helcobacillus massiliensis]|uniref:DUF808 family protein n=1 Tax=Helcobacillus massiliensis TaxID=521392 RepID=A0A839QXW3_9MICO|nr:DUF808 domain-containing protein [Helcobacillus massiliensis]MBB3022801.1 hypothetical protein [Helcobacillus massiliensis]
MAGGLAALLDDVAALARMAAANADDIAAASGRASAKAAGVVVDDTAVTPQFVKGVDPKRELPIIAKIARGSLINKAIIIVLAMLLSQFIPWLLTPLLMVGGTYLCYEGAHKILQLIGLLEHHTAGDEPAVQRGADAEKSVVSGAVRTDFILSAEIMVISLKEVADEAFWSRLITLIVVAVVITVAVYGVVALLVKLDDIGLAMMTKDSAGAAKFGEALVRAMPVVLRIIEYVGMLAMLWVGGHIILVGLDKLGWHAPENLVHALQGPVAGLAGIGGFLSWLVETVCSLILGIIWGSVVVGVVALIQRLRGKGHEDGAPTVQAGRERTGGAAAGTGTGSHAYRPEGSSES